MFARAARRVFTPARGIARSFSAEPLQFAAEPTLKEVLTEQVPVKQAAMKELKADIAELRKEVSTGEGGSERPRDARMLACVAVLDAEPASSKERDPEPSYEALRRDQELQIRGRNARRWTEANEPWPPVHPGARPLADLNTWYRCARLLRSGAAHARAGMCSSLSS